MIKVLVLDDEPDIASMVKVALEAVGGYQVRMSLTAAEARQAIVAEPPDLFILDLSLKEEDGLKVLQWLRPKHPTMPVVILTGLDAADAEAQVEGLGVLEIIEKPLTIPQIQQRVHAIVERLPKESR